MPWSFVDTQLANNTFLPHQCRPSSFSISPIPFPDAEVSERCRHQSSLFPGLPTSEAYNILTGNSPFFFYFFLKKQKRHSTQRSSEGPSLRLRKKFLLPSADFPFSC